MVSKERCWSYSRRARCPSRPKVTSQLQPNNRKRRQRSSGWRNRNSFFLTDLFGALGWEQCSRVGCVAQVKCETELLPPVFVVQQSTGGGERGCIHVGYGGEHFNRRRYERKKEKSGRKKRKPKRE
ncbi:Uncharacterized protein APZ42_026470 [Daphnia magna]|uniref:Uncharacterized protein n=1 Tax=Daphnia magna TaxID=35525 RepID=A0A164S7T0_9CRUS|nr:Uncharacterized protein APZ42_026470 [Daphnia magna]